MALPAHAAKGYIHGTGNFAFLILAVTHLCAPILIPIADVILSTTFILLPKAALPENF